MSPARFDTGFPKPGRDCLLRCDIDCESDCHGAAHAVWAKKESVACSNCTWAPVS